MTDIETKLAEIEARAKEQAARHETLQSLEKDIPILLRALRHEMETTNRLYAMLEGDGITETVLRRIELARILNGEL